MEGMATYIIYFNPKLQLWDFKNRLSALEGETALDEEYDSIGEAQIRAYELNREENRI